MPRRNQQKNMPQIDNIQLIQQVEVRNSTFRRELVEISQTFYVCHEIYRRDVYPHLKKYTKINNEADAQFNKLINAFVQIHESCFKAISEEKKSNTFSLPERNLYVYYGVRACYVLAEYYAFGPVIILDQALTYAVQWKFYEKSIGKQLDCSVWKELTESIFPYFKEMLAQLSTLRIVPKTNYELNRTQKKLLYRLAKDNDPTATVALGNHCWNENNHAEGYYFFWKAFFGYYEKSRIPVEFIKAFHLLQKKIEIALLNLDLPTQKVRYNHLLRLQIALQTDDKEIIKNEISALISLAAKILLPKTAIPQLRSLANHLGQLIEKLDKETFAELKKDCVLRAKTFFYADLKFTNQLPSFTKPNFVDAGLYYSIIQQKKDPKAIALSYSYLAAYYLQLSENDKELHQLNEAIGLFAVRQCLSKPLPILSSSQFPYYKVGEHLLKFIKEDTSLNQSRKQLYKQASIICFLNAFLFGEANALRYVCFTLQANKLIKPLIDEIFKLFLVNTYKTHTQLVTAFKPLIEALKVANPFIFNAIQYAWIFFLKSQPFHPTDVQQADVLNMALSSYKALIFYFDSENQKTESKIMDKYYKHIISELQRQRNNLEQKFSQFPQPQKTPSVLPKLEKASTEPVLPPKQVSKPKPVFKEIIPKPKRIKMKGLPNALSSEDKTKNAELGDEHLSAIAIDSNDIHKENKPDSPFDGLVPADLAAYGFEAIDFPPAVLNKKQQIEAKGYTCIIDGGVIWRKLIGNTDKHDFDFITDMPREIIIELFGAPHNTDEKESLCRYHINGHQFDLYFLPAVKLRDLGVFLACAFSSDGLNIYDHTGKGLAALRERSLATVLPEKEFFKLNPCQLFRGIKLYYTFKKEKKFKKPPNWQPYFKFLDQIKEKNPNRIVNSLMELLADKPWVKMVDVWFKTKLLAYLFPELSTERYTIFCLKEQLKIVQHKILSTENESGYKLSDHEQRQLIFKPFVAACCFSDLAYSFDLQGLAARYSELKQKNKILQVVYEGEVPTCEFFSELKEWLQRRLDLQRAEFEFVSPIAQLTIFKNQFRTTNHLDISLESATNIKTIS